MENPLKGFWKNSGIQDGDTVLIHSSMRRTLRMMISLGVKPDPGLIIDSLLGEIGKSGTLLFPLFNFDFPKSAFFSLRDTPSQMGTVTEYARNNFEGYRTGHPIYSFYAIGANSAEFSGIDNFSGYGSDSPFAKLREMNGKIGVIDLDDQNSMTSYHHVEEMCLVDYRYFKEFSGEYVDFDLEKSIRTYSLFVRNLEKGVLTDVNRMGEILWSEGFYRGNREGVGNGLRTILARDLYMRTALEIESGRAIKTLYSVNN